MTRGKNNPSRPPLRLEELEERIAPAGGILAAVSGGSLVITGDNLDNDIVIDQDGLAADEYRVSSGDDATLINDQAGPLIFSGVTKDLSFKLAGGDDELLVNGVGVAGNIKVDGGDGNNQESIYADVAGNLDVKNGRGNQSVVVGALVGKNLSIKNNQGDTLTDLCVEVEGNTSVTNNKGTHAVNIEDSYFGRNLQIKSVSGNTQTVIDYVDVMGNLSVKNGNGNDTLEINSSYLEKNLNINHGNGDTDTLLSEDSLVVGKVGVKCQNGVDVCIVDGSMIAGKFDVNTGHGESSVAIWNSTVGYNDATPRGTVFSNVSISSGNDLSEIWFADSYLPGNVKINNGNGSSMSVIERTEIGGQLNYKAQNGVDALVVEFTSVGGKTNINLGNGADMLGVDDSVFMDQFVANMGNDSDIVAIEINYTEGYEDPSDFYGKVNLIGANGDDYFQLGEYDVPGAYAVFYDAVTVNGGGGWDMLNVDDNGSEFWGPTNGISLEDVY